MKNTPGIFLIKQVLLFAFIFPVPVTLVAQITDTTKKLPFAIADEKKLPAEDLENKKEGFYVTGIPDISDDPVNGFGYGGEASFFFNGKKTDPFFEYTPYRAEIDLVLFNTTRNQREIGLVWDVPYIFNSRLRLRGAASIEANPNLLYFGTTEQTLHGLSYYPGNDSTQMPVSNATYHAYENSLTGSNAFYNTYDKREAILNVSVERSYLEGRMRILAGVELARLRTSSIAGNSLLQNDFNKGTVVGYGKNTIVFFQSGLIYDTRDLETDPSSGIYAELTNELSLTAFGSQFNLNKTFFHFNYYHKLFSSVFKKLVFAGRTGIGFTAGNSPFYEYQDQWTSEESIEGLGGGNTLRGYKQCRFMARLVQFNNVELRYRFAQTTLLKQHVAFSLVPFADAGAVWNDFSRVNHVENYRFSEGLGLRIAWNVNTILRFDYAFSKEDRQFFFQLGHSF